MQPARVSVVVTAVLVGLCSASIVLARAPGAIAQRSSTSPESVAGDAELVQVQLYGEALCPYCMRFTTTIVAPLFKQDVSSIFNFTYVAYGNALNTSSGPVCQHGAEECLFNRVINCAQHIKPAQNDWLPYVACVEGILQGDFQKDEAAAEKCAKDADIDQAAIKECVNGKLGDELDAKAKAATDGLKPAHSYVPWVTVNGVPLGADYGALKSVICAAYAGERPEVCFAVPPTITGVTPHEINRRQQGDVTLA